MRKAKVNLLYQGFDPQNTVLQVKISICTVILFIAVTTIDNLLAKSSK